MGRQLPGNLVRGSSEVAECALLTPTPTSPGVRGVSTGNGHPVAQRKKSEEERMEQYTPFGRLLYKFYKADPRDLNQLKLGKLLEEAGYPVKNPRNTVVHAMTEQKRIDSDLIYTLYQVLNLSEAQVFEMFAAARQTRREAAIEDAAKRAREGQPED